MYKSDDLKISIPIANSDHEPIVVIISLIVLTALSLGLARCAQIKIIEVCENRNVESETDSEDENDQ